MKKMEKLNVVLSLLGINKPNSKAGWLRRYLSVAELNDEVLQVTQSHFVDVKELYQVARDSGLWDMDVYASAEVKKLRAEGKTVYPANIARMYTLESRIRQRDKRARKKTDGKEMDAGPVKRITAKRLASMVVYLSRSKDGDREGDAYLAGLLDGLNFEAVKETGEKDFTPAWERFLADANKITPLYTLSIANMRKQYESVQSKQGEGKGLTPDESAILSAWDEVA